MIKITNAKGQQFFFAARHVVSILPHPGQSDHAQIHLVTGEPLTIAKESVERIVREVDGVYL